MTSAELLYVKTIVEEKSITKAAALLHISQPSLTQAVSRLERELGTSLFRRTSGGTFPTRAGELYYEMATDILARYQQFRDDLTRSRSLSVGASWYITTWLLSPVSAEFCSRYPDTELLLTEKNTAGLKELFRQGKLDLMLTHSLPYEDDLPGKQLHTEIVSSENLCVAAAASLNLSAKAEKRAGYRRAVLPLEALAHIPAVYFREDQKLRQLTDYGFRQAGIQPPMLLSTYGFQNALDSALLGRGFVLLPEHFLETSAGPGLEILDVDQSLNLRWHVRLTYRQQERTPAMEQFLQMLRASVCRV